MAHGILAAGAYIPRQRLQRAAIVQAHGWFNPALKGLGRGERAVAAWDEDPVTMAVEAARDCLGERDRAAITALRLASTSFPFIDRLHAGIVAAALALKEDLRASDHGGSQRCASSALLEALLGAGTTLVLAAEKRPTLGASSYEMTSGDAAAAILVGEGETIARLIGHASRTMDFVDHYRSMENPVDYPWEERWIREAGYAQLVPPLIAAALASAGSEAGQVSRFILPSTLGKPGAAMAKLAGLPEASIADTLMETCGDTGAAHPLLMLAQSLEQARAGEKILVVGFGQGADALLFEITGRGGSPRRGLGVAGHLARRKPEDNYARFLAINDTLAMERGMRAEADKQTALSALWRNRAALTAFAGGLCRACGTRQFPKTRICVAPGCNALDTQQGEPFAEKIGTIQSYTADRLTYSPDPPACYGMICFEQGGRWMMDFTDADESELEVGMAMRMMFRIKDFDRQRGFRRYFWKAAPSPPGSLTMNQKIRSQEIRSQEIRSQSLPQTSRTRGIRDKVAILGMGCSKFGERWEMNAEDLMVEAYLEALQDAGIATGQIDAAWLGTAIEEQHIGKSAVPLAMALRLPYIPCTRVENYCASGTEAFRGAVYAVASGAADIALALGVEKLKDTGYGGLPQRGRGTLNDMLWPNASAPGHFAQLAAAYRAKHGAAAADIKRAMAHISVKSHDNGAKNPKAHLRNRISIDTVLEAPMIAAPLGLFDCCGVSDGAACAILTTPEIARALGRRDLITVKALQIAVSNGMEAQHNAWDGSYFATTRIAARRAYDEAGIRNPREEINLIEVHDCFSVTELVTMEDLHISAEGRAIFDVLDGFYDAAGTIPCQIDGGLKCFGHPIAASGLRMIYELYLQMQGRAGERQRQPWPRLGLTHNLGGFPHQNVCSVSIIGQEGA